jgi:hypothetical protein
MRQPRRERIEQIDPAAFSEARLTQQRRESNGAEADAATLQKFSAREKMIFEARSVV